MITNTELAWLAGWLEGEGCFCAPVRTPRIMFVNTDLDIVERVCGLLEIAWYPCKVDLRHKVKPQWHGALCGKRAIGWMFMLYPYLGKRRREAVRYCVAQWHTQRKPGPKLGSKFGPRKKKLLVAA